MITITTDPRGTGPGIPARRPRLAALVQGRPGEPRWARPALLALLAATAALYTIGLSRNGWANDFYAAAVQAGTGSWKAFFFGSLDAGNFITVDKTPASLWVMELSARAFGLNSWSLLLPQAAEGVATVAMLYATVRRWHGPAAGLIAGTVAALTPVAVLMFRFNNPDALLVLLMTGAAYATTRAIESGRTRWLTLAGALLGFAFLTKMLQGFLVVPAFALAYLVAGPPRLGKRLWQLLAAGAALVFAAGWWVAIVQLTPAADRPYIGGSTGNSVLQLALGYNGLGRLDGNEAGSVGFGGGAGPRFSGSAGLTRLFAADMGGQASWLLPAALIGLAVMAWLSWRAVRTDRLRARTRDGACRLAGRAPSAPRGVPGVAPRASTARRQQVSQPSSAAKAPAMPAGWKPKPSASSRFGITRALDRMSLLTPPTASFSAGTGTSITAGRCTAWASAAVNSALLTGFGEVRFTGPVMSARPSRNRAAATQSDSPIQLITWRPDPSLPPSPSRNSGSSRPSIPPRRESTIPDRSVTTRMPADAASPAVASQSRTTSGRKPRPAGSDSVTSRPPVSPYQPMADPDSNTPGGAAIAASAPTSALVPWTRLVRISAR